jgi:DNA-binding Xre family transcriptional regulator
LKIRPKDPRALAIFMVKSGYTCRGLARAAGLSDSTVANLLDPHGRGCNPSTAQKLCRALGMDFDDLFVITD